MSLIHSDSFEAYDITLQGNANTDLSQIWTENLHAVISSNFARTGSQCLGVGTEFATSAASQISFPFTNRSEVCLGFSLYMDNTTWRDDMRYTICTNEGDAETFKMDIRINSTGNIELYENGVKVLETLLRIQVKAHHYLEMRLKTGLLGSGIMEVRLEGYTILYWATTVIGDIDKFKIRGIGQGLGGTKDIFFDDFYILDNDGLFPSTFLGPVSMLTRTVIEDVSGNWVSTEASNFAALDNKDTAKFITGSEINDSVLLGFSDAGNEVFAVFGQTLFYKATKTTNGPSAIAPFIERLGITETGTLNPLSINQVLYSETFNRDPITNSQQSRDQLNATNAGFVRV